MLSPDQNKIKIIDFLSKYISNKSISDSDDIFALGLVNSMFAMELVLFIEKNFGLQINNEDLDINNFRSINAIDKLINQKISAQGK